MHPHPLYPQSWSCHSISRHLNRKFLKKWFSPQISSKPYPLSFQETEHRKKREKVLKKEKKERKMYRVVKIACSCSEVFLQTMKSYKAHNSLSWFRPLLWGNSPTPIIFVLENKNNVTKGVRWEVELFIKCKGKMFLPSPSLRGRGPFIAKKQPENYKLLSITNVSMKGFTRLVGPNTG
jgi:hypothetical protein